MSLGTGIIFADLGQQVLECIPVPVLNVIAGKSLKCQLIQYLLWFGVQAEDEPWEIATVKEELREETATAEYGLGTKRLGDLHYLG
jgi:hypothetical protein